MNLVGDQLCGLETCSGTVSLSGITLVAGTTTIYAPAEMMDSNMHLSDRMSFLLLAEIYRRTSKLMGECDERIYALLRMWALEDEWHQEGLLLPDPDYCSTRPVRILFALEQCHGHQITDELLHEWQMSDAHRHILDDTGHILSGPSPISSTGGSRNSRFALSSGSFTDNNEPTLAEATAQVRKLQISRPSMLMMAGTSIEELPGGAPAEGYEVLQHGNCFEI
jgi:hypothetical protein